jgi:RNA polymerase sigma factor (sigma-70 family)
VKERLYLHLTTDPSLRRLAKRTAGDVWEDVLQEVGVVICGKSDEELERISNYFDFWCVRTIINMTATKRVTGKYSERSDDNVQVADIEADEYSTDIDETARQIEQELKRLHWYDRDVFMLYFESGSFRKASAATGIPVSSIHATVTRVRKQLKNKLCE